MKLTLLEAERFETLNQWSRWDGWNLKLYHQAAAARTKSNGAWYNETWCTVIVIKPNEEGMYDIPNRYVRVNRN